MLMRIPGLQGLMPQDTQRIGFYFSGFYLCPKLQKVMSNPGVRHRFL